MSVFTTYQAPDSQICSTPNYICKQSVCGMIIIYYTLQWQINSLLSVVQKCYQSINSFCSPNSSRVVSASFCLVWSVFSVPFHFGHPPNIVTSVRVRPKLKAVVVCNIRGCTFSGRVNCEEAREENKNYPNPSLLRLLPKNCSEIVFEVIMLAKEGKMSGISKHKSRRRVGYTPM